MRFFIYIQLQVFFVFAIHGVKLFGTDEDVGIFVELRFIIALKTKRPLNLLTLWLNADQNDRLIVFGTLDFFDKVDEREFLFFHQV
jgi:hypothetical protein